MIPENIRDKQRIIIAGSEGRDEVFELVKKVLTSSGKPFTSMSSGDSNIPDSNTPIALINCADEHIHTFEHHIALITSIKDKGSSNYDEYVRDYEKMLDNLPKAGCVIYNTDDSASALIGKKERDDVVRLEYGTPESKNGEVKIEDQWLSTENIGDLSNTYLNGAYTLSKRIGITPQKFIDALS